MRGALPHSRLSWTRPLLAPLVPLLIYVLAAGPGQRVIVSLIRGPEPHVCACSLSNGHVCRCAKCLGEATRFDETPAGYHATDCDDDDSTPSLSPVAKMLPPASPSVFLLASSHMATERIVPMQDRRVRPPIPPPPIRVVAR